MQLSLAILVPMNEKTNSLMVETWRLFITTHATLIGIIDKEMADADVVPLHWYDVLIELYEAPDRKLRMHELAERVVLSRSGLTRLVDRLEKAGYLQREVDPEDRRGFFTVITDEGVNALRTGWKVYEQGIKEHFARFLSEEEAIILQNAFTRMLEATRDE
ncbi:MAG: MarR family transcriptional regulator [Chloroflexi bacterium]|nr:MarR family transcriptional regulator [Chloroflexota bacterium]